MKREATVGHATRNNESHDKHQAEICVSLMYEICTMARCASTGSTMRAAFSVHRVMHERSHFIPCGVRGSRWESISSYFEDNVSW